MTTHTLGPWTWDGDVCAYDHEQESPWLLGPNNRKVLFGTIDCNNSWDASLIAAAPDLLAALRLAQWAMRAPFDEWKGECERKALDAARTAIAKATGADHD